ncbi:Very-long-chain 3-oxoacyl-CoA reductase,Very-long-chain 3-oxoacyl-CoA reductase-A [Lepeophtheirus salmonis]|uniref:Very-long-chain 3-oxoacyl-CoA reductase,Very-long-chain 3-oxoacyl-CoA reductase-A n=1 Tax=Lepeophtheirus salmonis TaxID=72036 RepID=A0A7R8CI91_LEPSM|nr:Very-long-chain 3-oxoacyl-CoA reductase,Very-long-chain 3-oxoacyl-CoA reductase-A [Lepeophtheirus salmonis]CAF2829485.1 Very-long-chain 3-oxoacyl-CoA reductase,Very-long-chain 3-oxoacyl-CoA reductase-A [Lepeophtheirus salmonis]
MRSTELNYKYYRIILIMALIVERVDLLVNEVFKGIRNSSLMQYSALLGGSVVAYTVGKFLYQLADGIRIHFWSRVCRINLKEKYGDWAIVTGCTSGIGRAITIELASRGINLALIARNPTFLKDLSEYIENEFKVKTLVIKADFKDTGIYEDIRDQLKPIENELGMLFNNVGMSLDQVEDYTIAQNPSILDVINTNISSVALMSKIGIKMMETRRRGIIVNVSSIAGIYVLPLASLYSSTKGFVNHFSRNMYYECRQKGISVQNLVPMGVRTNMLRSLMSNDDIGNTWTTPTSEVYAYNAINTVGRTYQTSGYWCHSVGSVVFWYMSIVDIGKLSRKVYLKNPVPDESTTDKLMRLSIPSFKSNETELRETISGDDLLTLYPNERANQRKHENVKNFNTRKPKWIPGVTVEKISTSIWTVHINGKLETRHLNKLRRSSNV